MGLHIYRQPLINRLTHLSGQAEWKYRSYKSCQLLLALCSVENWKIGSINKRKPGAGPTIVIFVCSERVSSLCIFQIRELYCFGCGRSQSQLFSALLLSKLQWPLCHCRQLVCASTRNLVWHFSAPLFAPARKPATKIKALCVSAIELRCGWKLLNRRQKVGARLVGFGFCFGPPFKPVKIVLPKLTSLKHAAFLVFIYFSDLSATLALSSIFVKLPLSITGPAIYSTLLLVHLPNQLSPLLLQLQTQLQLPLKWRLPTTT